MTPRQNLAQENLNKLRCPVIFGFNRNGKTRLIYCGQWSCTECRKRLAKRWAVRVKLHIAQDETNDESQWFFLTLTMGGRTKNVARAYQALPKLWNRLRMAINRAIKGRKWAYVAFVEGQPKRSYMPHFHIILDVYPPAKQNKHGIVTQHNLQNWAVKMGFGFKVECEPVVSDLASWYVSKYVSKGSPHIPKGFRRVRVSRGWTKLPVDPARKLIVIQRGESVVDYILRVSDVTGVEHSLLVTSYFDAKRELELANLDTGEL